MEALIVSKSDKIFAQLAEIIRSIGDFNVVLAQGSAAARRVCAERDFDVALINMPSGGEGKTLSQELSSNEQTIIILIEDSIIYEETAAELEDYGVMVIPRPMSRITLVSAIKMAQAMRNKIKYLHEKNNDLVKKMEDTKIVNKAKYTLISSLGYTENQAHKYIEKRAMDERRTKKDIAIEILKTYEL